MLSRSRAGATVGTAGRSSSRTTWTTPPSKRSAWRQARGSEDRQHAAVEEQRVRDEPADPELPRPGREPFEQHGSEATALPRVGHHEGDLGLVAAVPETVEPRDADDLPVVDGDERLAVDVVDVGEPVQLLIAQIGVHAEEPQPDRLTGQRVVELIQPIDVAGAHRLDVDRRAVEQHRRANRGFGHAPSWITPRRTAQGPRSRPRVGSGRQDVRPWTRSSRCAMLARCPLPSW